MRKRARSRSPRTSGPGSQISGTRPRRASSANTQASIRSVLHASGAIPFARCASAIRTSQPASSSWSCTNRAPVIDSIAANTGAPCSRSTSRTRCASPSRSGGEAPSPIRPPSAASACQSRRLRLRSNPTYNTVGPPSLMTRRSLSGEPEALLHRIHYERATSEGCASTRRHERAPFPASQAFPSLEEWTRVPARARAGVPVLYPQRCVSVAARHATLEGVTSINGTSSLLRRTSDAAARVFRAGRNAPRGREDAPGGSGPHEPWLTARSSCLQSALSSRSALWLSLSACFAAVLPGPTTVGRRRRTRDGARLAPGIRLPDHAHRAVLIDGDRRLERVGAHARGASNCSR
jgi:hypothetical protein